MKRLAMICLVISFSLSVLGQGKKKDQEVEIINHEVQLGESVRLISKKYLVDPAEIYKLNKFAVEGISQGMILKIPVPKKEGEVVQQEENTDRPETISQTETEKVIEEKKPVAEKAQPKASVPITSSRTEEITHTIEAKETMYSLSRRFGVSVEALRDHNPQLAKGLKIGQVIKIPPTTDSGESIDVLSEPTPVAQAAPTVVTHKVEPKETLYSLSKKYNVTVDEIKQQNEVILQHGLQIGQVLTIKKN